MNTLSRLFGMLTLVLCFSILNGNDARGETIYVVKEGDTLSQIAKRFSSVTWKDLQKANGLKNPHRIFPKQELRIPLGGGKIAKASAAKPETPFAQTAQELCKEETPAYHWREVGANPCVDCPPEQSIHGLGYPEKVADALIENVKNKEYVLGFISPGDTFDAMYFGLGVLRCNVVAAWEHDRKEPAKVYAVEHEGVRYELYDPLRCGNWSKRTVKLPPPAPPPKEPVKEPDEPVAQQPPALPESIPVPPITLKPKEPCDCPELITLAIFEPLKEGGARRFWHHRPKEERYSPFPSSADQPVGD